MTSSIRFLMCSPHYYEVDYVINPWMEGNIHRSSLERAQEQWQGLYETIASRAAVDLVEPQPGWPDMVFTANAGLILGNQVVLSRFLHPERQGEEPFLRTGLRPRAIPFTPCPPIYPLKGPETPCSIGRAAGFGLVTGFAPNSTATPWWPSGWA
jgi:N-dimethylarginine dimethylaminohydrolase